MEKERDFVIELNVGGKKIGSLKSTLTKEPNSLLARMVIEDVPSTLDRSGRIFLDCDPDIFSHMLDFLRFGLQPPHDKVIHVYEYAKHFEIRQMVHSLEQFKTVQYKRRADEAKSKLDLEKYETLKQNIIGKLASLSQNVDKSFSIVTIGNATNNISDCLCENRQPIGLQVHGRYPYAKQVTVSKPPVPTEIPITDDNLLIALREDLFQLGHGKLRYYRGRGTCMSCCHLSRDHLYILLSKKNENDNLDSISPPWAYI